MEKEILDEMKQEYKDMKLIANGDYSEIEELKENPAVKRYLYLMRLKDDRELIEYGESCIINLLIRKYGNGEIKESGNIWFFYFEAYAYQLRNERNLFVSFDDVTDDQVVVIYCDIEDSSKFLAISKERQAEFEASHNVVYGDMNNPDRGGRYYKERCRIFREILDDSNQ